MSESDNKLQEAVAFFEQILQTIPGDRTSLESLAIAYEKLEQPHKRRECLIKLTHTLLKEHDLNGAKAIAELLKDEKEYPAAMQAVALVAAATELAPSMPRAVTPLPTAPSELERPVFKPSFQDATLEYHNISQAAAAAEIEMVWFWRDHNLVPEKVCTQILQTLTEIPVVVQPDLISALALLDELHSELTDVVLEKMQEVSKTPLLPLDSFEPQEAAANLLPRAFAQIRGVLPFGTMHDEVLVALLNPLNEKLHNETRARIGRPCHFYLVYPKAWQQAAAQAYPAVVSS